MSKWFSMVAGVILATAVLAWLGCSDSSKSTDPNDNDQPPTNMVLIPATTFTMGTGSVPDSSAQDVSYSTPAHAVTVASYYIDKYEVTQAEYRAFVLATGHRTPFINGTSTDTDSAYVWTGTDFPAGLGTHPVVGISSTDAEAYCSWKGKRLPTEAEWELAARGTDQRTYPWGNGFDSTKCNVWIANAAHGTVPVGTYSEGVSPYGLFDMAGNAMEWTSSWLLPYPGHPDYGSVTTTTYKAMRGGSWDNQDSSDKIVTTYGRSGNGVERIDRDGGCRCAKDAH